MADQFRNHQDPSAPTGANVQSNTVEYLISHRDPIPADKQMQHFSTAFLFFTS
jgi:hypothetical protein